MNFRKVLFNIFIIVMAKRKSLIKFVILIILTYSLIRLIYFNPYSEFLIFINFLAIVYVIDNFVYEFYKFRIYRDDRSVNMKIETLKYLGLILSIVITSSLMFYFGFNDNIFLVIIFGIMSSLMAKKLVFIAKRYVIVTHGLTKFIRFLKKDNIDHDILIACDILDLYNAHNLYNSLSREGHNVFVAYCEPGDYAVAVNLDILDGVYKSKMYVILLSYVFFVDFRYQMLLLQIISINIHLQRCVIVIYEDSMKERFLDLYKTFNETDFEDLPYESEDVKKNYLELFNYFKEPNENLNNSEKQSLKLFYYFNKPIKNLRDTNEINYNLLINKINEELLHCEYINKQ